MFSVDSCRLLPAPSATQELLPIAAISDGCHRLCWHSLPCVVAADISREKLSHDFQHCLLQSNVVTFGHLSHQLIISVVNAECSHRNSGRSCRLLPQELLPVAGIAEVCVATRNSAGRCHCQVVSLSAGTAFHLLPQHTALLNNFHTLSKLPAAHHVAT